MTDSEYRYILRLPTALERARARVRHFEEAARRYGLHDLIEGDKAA